MEKLAGKKNCSPDSFEVKELVGEYGFVTKQMYQMPDVTAMALEMAAVYCTNPEIQAAQDRVYGEGATEFVGQAIKAFYKKSNL